MSSPPYHPARPRSVRDLATHRSSHCTELQDVPLPGALGGDADNQQGLNFGAGDGASTQCFGDEVASNESSQNGCEPNVCNEATPDHWEDAAPVELKVGGTAMHPTLGNVTILQLGSLGASIEFFSNRLNCVTTRRVMRSDIMPLPDTTDLRNLSNGDEPADLRYQSNDRYAQDDPMEVRSSAMG